MYLNTSYDNAKTGSFYLLLNSAVGEPWLP